MPGVYLHSGEFQLSAVDLRIPGRGLDLVWARKYRSRRGPSSALGHGWDFSYNLRIEAAGSDVRLFDGNTRSDLYRRQPDDSYTARQFFREGAFDLAGSFMLTFADTGTWIFRPLDANPAPGRIEGIVDRNGNALSFAYDGLGRLVTIIDTLSRAVTLTYDASGRIETVTDFTGRVVRYAYYQASDLGGSEGDLKSVTTPAVVGTPNGNDFPAGKTTVYTYSTGFADSRLNHNLLTVTDPKGQTWLRNTYASMPDAKQLLFDRLVTQARGNPGDRLEFVYVPQGALPGDAQSPVVRAIVNDRVGNVREYFYDARSRLVLQREFTGRALPGVPTTPSVNRPENALRLDDPAFFETIWAHNDDSLVTRIVHPNGNETRKVYELELDPGAPTRSRGNLRELHRLPDLHMPPGDQPELTELFEYATGMGGCCGTNFVTRHVDARGNETQHTYDNSGNRLQTVHRIPSIVENWEYNAFGQMTAHTLPDNGSASLRRDEYRYYGPSDGAQNGYLKEVAADAPNLALTTLYEYDAVGNVVRKVDPRGNDTLYSPNALNQLVLELSPLVGGVRYEKLFFYDANDNLVRVDVENRDEDGALQSNFHFTTTWDYEILNERERETREVDVGSTVVTEYAYDANRNRTLVRYPAAVAGTQPENTVSTLYDERDLVWRIIEAEGADEQATTQHDYDRNGNERAMNEGLEEAPPHVTRYVYDGYDRLLSETDPMGNVRLYHYDANGNLGGNQIEEPPLPNPFALQVEGELVDVSDSTGNVRLAEVQYAYDAMDRRVIEERRFFDPQTQDPIGDGNATTSSAWSANSQVLSRTDDNGHTTTTTYDTANRRGTVTDAKGNTTSWGYDANSNVVELTEVHLSDLGNPPETFATSFAYDNLDRLVEIVDDLSNATRYGHDSRSNRTVQIDDRSNVVRHAYDGLNRLVSSVRDLTDDGTGAGLLIGTIVTTQSWDASSRLIETVDDNGNTTAHEYDARNRRVATIHADCTASDAMYDVHGNPVSRTDANGTLVETSHDALHRPIDRRIALGSGVLGTTGESYQYDGLSRIVRAEDDDSIVTRRHDSLSNVTFETQHVLPLGAPQLISSTFDGDGNLTRLVYPGGRTIERVYDSLDRAVLVRDERPGPGSIVATFAYAGPRRLERRDHGNGTRLLIDYDAIQNVIRTRHTRIATGAPLDDRIYDWLCAHVKLARHELVSLPVETVVYAYDSVDRLVSSTNIPSGCTSTYSLDGVGNRTAVAGCVDPGVYTMDPTPCEPADFQVNQYTTTPFDDRVHDDNGNLTAKPGALQDHGHDWRNQLVQFADLSNGQLTEYRHDCLGRRIEKDVAGSVTRYYYAGRAEIEEQDAGSATLATYVFGAGPRELLQMKRGTQKYYFHADDQQSVAKVTDALGNVVEQYAYPDFGKPKLSDGSGNPITTSNVGNPWLFDGLRHDHESGLYLLGDHHLDPCAGRFVTSRHDLVPLSWEALGNRYAFAANNPVRSLASAFEAPTASSLGLDAVAQNQDVPQLTWTPGTSPEGPCSDVRLHVAVSDLYAVPVVEGVVGMSVDDYGAAKAKLLAGRMDKAWADIEAKWNRQAAKRCTEACQKKWCVGGTCMYRGHSGKPHMTISPTEKLGKQMPIGVGGWGDDWKESADFEAEAVGEALCTCRCVFSRHSERPGYWH